MIRKASPKLVSSNIVSVQPMTGPVGGTAFYDPKPKKAPLRVFIEGINAEWYPGEPCPGCGSDAIEEDGHCPACGFDLHQPKTFDPVPSPSVEDAVPSVPFYRPRYGSTKGAVVRE